MTNSDNYKEIELPSLKERIKLFLETRRKNKERTGITHYRRANIINKLLVNIYTYRKEIYTNLIKDSLALPEATWKYNKQFGLFLNKPEKAEQLALVLPQKGHTKYVVIGMGEGKNIVAALPLDLHADIVSDLGFYMNKNLHNRSIRGGHALVHNSNGLRQIALYGSSQDYGQANHDKVAEVLNNSGLEVRVLQTNEEINGLWEKIQGRRK